MVAVVRMSAGAGSALVYTRNHWLLLVFVERCDLGHMELKKHLQRLPFEAAPLSRVPENLVRAIVSE